MDEKVVDMHGNPHSKNEEDYNLFTFEEATLIAFDNINNIINDINKIINLRSNVLNAQQYAMEALHKEIKALKNQPKSRWRR